MKMKLIALLCLLAVAASMTGCREEVVEEETTLSGIVISVDGSVINLVEMANADRGNAEKMPQGEKGSKPAGDFEGFGETVPEGGRSSMPEGERPSRQEGAFAGSGGTLPEGETMPSVSSGGRRDRMETAESSQIDLANAHITVEFDGGKASGSMEDITVGTYVTVTLNSEGQATKVVVSEASGFGGRSQGFGGNGGFREMPEASVPEEG